MALREADASFSLNTTTTTTAKARVPLGEQNSCVVYNIPCGCGKFSYTGETDRKFKTRKGEHQDKIRLTNKDLEEGNNERAEERMNTGDGGLTRHAIRCNSNIAWEKSKIVGKERGWTQRKCLEGIESLRRNDRGEEPLNSYNKMEQWQPVLLLMFGRRKIQT